MPDFLILILTVPVITGLIGWLTNWAAVKMIFSPTEFVGIGPIGWQAVMTKQGDKFAKGFADRVTDTMASVPELAGRLDIVELEALFDNTIGDQLEAICRDAANIIKPGSWDELLPQVRQMILTQVQSESRKLTREVFTDVQGKAEDFLDLNDLVFKQLSGENIERLIRLTKNIAKNEFKFIEYYGGVFGFLIGLMQVGVWKLLSVWWLMPVVGVVVGLVTNWLAIQMIFRPQEPKKYFGLVTYQGLFAKRQPEIAADYGRAAEEEILTPKVIMQMVSEGEAGERISKYVTELVTAKLTEQWDKVKGMIPVEVTPGMIDEVKGVLATRMMESAPVVMPDFEKYLAEKLAVRETVETRLGAMPKDEFERILRGVFEEDELTLIVVGGVLGGAVGCLQAMLVLGMNL